MYYHIINCINEELDKNIDLLRKNNDYRDLSSQIEVKKITNNNSLIIAVFFHENFSGIEIKDTGLEVFFNNRVKFCHTYNKNITTFDVPINYPDHFYCHKTDNGYWITNDLRVLGKNFDLSYDKKGFYSLFKYGITQANLSVYEGVEKIQNGYRLIVDENNNFSTEITEATLNIFKCNPNATINSMHQVFSNLCSIIGNTPKGSIILFSGGLDSTLLALAAKELGRDDITLFNLRFGKNDPSARLAEETASLLQMKFKQVCFDYKTAENILPEIDKIFSKPFVDLATIPAVFMVKEAEKHFPDCKGVFIDGSSADSTFGGFGCKYYKIYKKFLNIPLFLRKAISKAYDSFNIWQRNDKIEVICRNLRKTALCRPEFIHMVNSFDKILYSCEQESQTNIENSMKHIISQVEKSVAPRNRIDMTKMFHGCLMASIFKIAHSAQYIGRKVVYPFMEENMINLCFSLQPEQRFNCKEAKILIKEITKEKLPDYPGFRKKMALIPPFSEMFKCETIKNIMKNNVLSEQNRVLDFINTKKVRQVWNYIQKHNSELNAECSEIIWCIIFSSILLRRDNGFDFPAFENELKKSIQHKFLSI